MSGWDDTGPWDGLGPWDQGGTDFEFYVTNMLQTMQDRVSSTPIAITLTTGRPIGDDGTLAGTDLPTIDSDNKLNTFGAFEQLIMKTRDISDAVWSASGSSTKLSPTIWQASAQYEGLAQTVSTIEGELYTLSFMASVGVGARGTDIRFKHSNSGTGSSSALAPTAVLTSTPTLFTITVLGKVGDGSVAFGIEDHNTSDYVVITITYFQVTQSAYRLPYLPNDSAVATLSSPLNYSTATGSQGYRYPLSTTPLLDSILDNGTGNFQIEWTPMFNDADVTGSINILTANDEAVSFLLYDADNQKLLLFDGTNTAEIALTAVLNTQYLIDINLGVNTGQQMQIGVDSVGGTITTNVGSLPNSTDLAIAWDADDWQKVKLISAKDTPTWL